MKTVSVVVDDAVYQSVENIAGELNTSVDVLLREYLGGLQRATGQRQTGPETNEEDDRRQRAELVEALKNCNLVLGYQPTREQTYER